MSRVDFDKPEFHQPIPSHSCKHCQRIVLGEKHFIGTLSCLDLPHTTTEIQQAVDEKCELILLFASAKGPTHSLFCSGCSECESPPARQLNKLAMIKYLPSLPMSDWLSSVWKTGNYLYKPRSSHAVEPFAMILERDKTGYYSLSFHDSPWRRSSQTLSPRVKMMAIGVTGNSSGFDDGEVFLTPYRRNRYRSRQSDSTKLQCRRGIGSKSRTDVSMAHGMPLFSCSLPTRIC